MKVLALILLIFVSGFGMAQSTLKLENKSNLSTYQDVDLSSDYFYNLGIDYYYKKELGKAIWAFESAIKIDPSNVDAIFNLNLVNTELENSIIKEPKGVSSWFKQNVFGVSPNFWFYVSLISGFITVILLYIFFTPTSKTINNISLSGTVLFGIILVASFSFSLLHRSQLTNNTKAIIINPKTSLLADPVLDATMSFEVNEGSQLNIITTQDDWYQLEVENVKGWILKDSVWVY